MTEATEHTRISRTASGGNGSLTPGMRRAIIGILLLIVVVLGALVFVTDGPYGDEAGAAASNRDRGTVVDDDGDASDDIDDATEDALDAADDSAGYPDGGENVAEPSGGSGGDGADEPVELEPAGGVDDGCAQALAAGARLVVTPDPAVLEPGDMSDALAIRNCGDEDVTWTAKTVPTVALDTAGSTLAGGTTAPLGFTIDSSAHEPGAIEFKIKVSEPGHNHYVDVRAFRQTVGKDVAAGNGFSAGADAGGCANSCITKAWLSPNADTPDVAFEVRTDTPATIRVWADTQPPGGGAPMAASAPGTTQWNTVLEPLEPTTTYHLRVTATDENGNADTRSTTFKTITPMDGPGDLAAIDPGCLAQCISKAVLTPGADFSVKHLAVEAQTPARFQAHVSTEAPTDDGGVPSFDETDVFANSGLTYTNQWSTELSPLQGDTTYHIIVRAEDSDGHAAHQVGSFQTPDEPTHDVVITFHRVEVTHDGDSSWKNRGELSFAWGAADATVGTRGESKMSDGDSFGFDPWKNHYVATGLHAGDFVPTVYVSGSERDADGKVEFCSMGTGVAHTPGSNGDCDAKWNVASSGLVSVGSIDSLTRCSEHGLDGPAADAACLLLETVDQGDDYARFQVVVSYHVVG